MVTPISSVDTAATVGSISVRMPSHICLGRVAAPVPLTKIATTTSSNDVMKAKQRGGDDAGTDERERDEAEGLPPVRAEVLRGKLQRLVETVQGGGDDHDDERQRQDGVGEDQAVQRCPPS